MRKKGSIIILLDSEGMEVKNFLYMLSGYKGIQNYELILVYQKDTERVHQYNQQSGIGEIKARILSNGGGRKYRQGI